MQIAELEAVIQPAVLAVGCTLEGLEVQQGKRPQIRVFIDKPPKGVGVDECAEASRQIDAALAVADLGLEDYRLEVSSPGLDRRLFTVEQMAQRVGERVRVRILVAQESQREFEGELIAANAQAIEIEDDTARRWHFEQQSLQWVRLVPVL